jgi:flagellar hook-length control protein FliK
MTSTSQIGSAHSSPPSPRPETLTRGAARDEETRKSESASFSRSAHKAETEARARHKTGGHHARAAQTQEASTPKPDEASTQDASTEATPEQSVDATDTTRASSTPAPQKSKGTATPASKDGAQLPAEGEGPVAPQTANAGDAQAPAVKKSAPAAAKTITPAEMGFADQILATLRPLAAAATMSIADGSEPTDAAAPSALAATVSTGTTETAALPTSAPSHATAAPEFVVPQVEAAPVPKDAPIVERAKAPLAAHAQERAHDILNQLRVHVSVGTRDALVQLHPVELGRISIRISTEGGRVRAHVRAERVETLDTLQRHLPELRASFAQQGLEAQDFQLSLGFQNGAREEWRGDAPRASKGGKPDENSTISLPNPSLVRAIASESSIDTFA